MRRVAVAVACWAVLCVPFAAVTVDGAVGVEVSVEPRRATVGDRVLVELAVRLAEGTQLEEARLGPELGPFSVVEESWIGPVELEGGLRGWTWRGIVTAYRTGELELPGIRIRARPQDGEAVEAVSDPVTVTIESVLDPDGDEEELADLKPPAAVPGDYAPLVAAAAIIALLLLASLLAWWLHRRYGARLAAVAPVEDPFRRIPPDTWIYAELQRLLDRRLAEEGRVGEFFAELSRILKVYLGGRFRLDLMERTTDEVPEELRQSQTSEPWIEEIHSLLVSCDRVKFARERPEVEDCREAIERTYRIVDATKPRASEEAAGAA